MAAAFSTSDALAKLTKSIPDWNKRLDDLNGQIAQRQIELARLVDPKPPRSIKNKGSTESLRPKDGEEATTPRLVIDTHHESENATSAPQFFGSPKSGQNEFKPSSALPESPTVARAAAAAALEYNQTPKPLTPRASPNALTRQSSQPTQPTEPRPPNVLRKRKTESLASGGSQAPRYRTRSMIIVYYDSAVQTAFEELVKFVSGNRNAMRKGKMAAKMDQMRRAAEMEAEEDSDEEENESSNDNNLSAIKNQHSTTLRPSSPKLNFVSTRMATTTRDRASAEKEMENIGSTMNMLKGYRRAGGGGGGGAAGAPPDIFDELDKGLEWCQGQCEHAAHQFLRDGDCSTEIENLKRKLNEVKEVAERKLVKLKEEEEKEKRREREKEEGRKDGENANGNVDVDGENLKKGIDSRQQPLNMEVDDNMDVDDGDGDDDSDLDFDPRKLVFKRAR